MAPRSKRSLIVLSLLICGTLVASAIAQEAGNPSQDKDLAADLKLMQGSWELKHNGTRSVKTIEGNKQTMRRYDAKTGKLRQEYSVTFELSKSGDVRVYTFFIAPGAPGMSYVYRVDENNFWDVPGLLQGEKYQNYRPTPNFYQWKRIKTEEQK